MQKKYIRPYSTNELLVSRWLWFALFLSRFERITHVEYDKRLVEMKHKEQDLLDELSNYSKADEEFLISSSYLLELAKRALELFNSSQPGQKNKILKIVLANLELKDGKLVPKLKNFFQGVLISNERQEWLHRLEAIGRCFASGESRYFPYHVVNGYINGIGVRAGK